MEAKSEEFQVNERNKAELGVQRVIKFEGRLYQLVEEGREGIQDGISGGYGFRGDFRGV